MAKAGLPKLNLATKSISIKSSASSSLSGAQRCGISYGIMAQRSNTSIFSPKLAYSNSTSAMRHELNRKVVINNNMPPIKAQQDNGMSTMEKLMMFASMGSMATQLGKGIANTITELKGSKADTSNNNSNVDGKGSTGSLADLSKENTKVNGQINKFGQDYSKIAKENVDAINSGLDKFKSNKNTSKYLNSLDTNVLANQDLGLTDKSSLDEITTAGQTITKDIGEVQSFVQNVNTVLGEVATGLQSVNGQIAGLEGNTNRTPEENQKLTELKQEKKDLEDLQKELKNNVLREATSLEEKLQKESGNLTKLADEKKQVMDKMYAQAQADDKAIGENNKKMQALDTKIKAEKDDTKKQKLIAQYNKMAGLNKGLAESLKAAGEIKSAAGTPFSATNLAEAKVEPYPTDGTTAGSQNSRASAQILQHSAGNQNITSSNNSFMLANEASISSQLKNVGDSMVYPGTSYTITKESDNSYKISGLPKNRQNSHVTKTCNSVREAIDYINKPEYMRIFDFDY